MSSDFSSPVGLINVEGLISGLDISNILQQISQVRRRPIEVLQQHQQQLQDTLSLYQTLETHVLSLQTAVQDLAATTTFEARNCTSSDTSALSVSADPGTALGTYSITINQLAQAHKISSASFTASNQALGLQGDILINGQHIYIESDDDLLSIASAINRADAGVQATVVQVAENDYRLMLTSLQTGADNAIELTDANSSSVLVSLGLVQSSTAIKHAITNGAASDALSSSLDPVGTTLQLNVPPAGTVQINDTAVYIDLSVDSLQDIADRINSTVSGVTATVQTVTVDGEIRYQLEVVGDTGAPTLTDDNNVLVTLGVLTKAAANEIQAAQDAELVLDGITITRSTNDIDDVISGLHLQLQKADPSSTITVTVDRDIDSAVEAVRNFVEAYNTVIDFIRQNQTFDADTSQGGAFMSNYEVVALESDLRRAVTYPIEGFSTSDTLLASQIGITTDQQDHLVLDESQLRQALSSDPTGFVRYFVATGEATHSAIEYVGSTPQTQPSPEGGYAIQITQVATRARAESAALPSGITQDETLTFYGQYTVQLFAGMTLDQAAEALNSMFDQHGLGLTASVSGDQLVIEHDLYGSDYTIEIASSLDDGAGGTDLGGPTAGQVQTYSGTDVAGTIGGEPATGSGRYLTGNEDNANTAGLCVRVSATTPGDYGAVHLAKGLAQRLLDVISGLEDPDTGMFARTTESLNNRIDQLQEDIQTMEERLQAYLNDLRRKFLAMEEALGQAQALSQYISNQLIGIQRLTYGSGSSS